MFLYQKGLTDSFRDIARKHYEGLKAVRIYADGSTGYYVQSIIDRSEKLSRGKGVNANFFKDLIANNYELLEKIITGDHNDLKKVLLDYKQQELKRRYPAVWRKKRTKGRVLTAFGRLVTHVFDYDTFVYKASQWTAYDLAKLLGIDVCAYCNRNYTYTLTSPKNTVRPELDHFLPKSIYPFLALSFYNLVPSCHICNSSLKHSKEFSYENNIHPYSESIDEILRFSIRLTNKKKIPLPIQKDTFGLNFFYGNLDGFELVFKSRKTKKTVGANGKFETIRFRKALNNLKVFKIKELYNFHKDLVVEIMQAAILYNDDYVESLYQTYKGSLFNSKEDVLRLVTRNYHLPDEILKRPFSKLTKDIFEELGLTY